MPLIQALVSRLNATGAWLPALGLRLILAWEFFEAGREKFSGMNWFMDIKGQFPFPFNMIPTQISWQVSTWFELIAAIALLLGLGTRFFAFGLLFLTAVATSAVHLPQDWMGLGDLLQGYAITNKGHGNYKLPLLYIVMLLPLLFQGAGTFSLDWLLAQRNGIDGSAPILDLRAVALALALLGFPMLMLFPWLALATLIAALISAIVGFRRNAS
jgi:putative oxidoreductase